MWLFLLLATDSTIDFVERLLLLIGIPCALNSELIVALRKFGKIEAKLRGSRLRSIGLVLAELLVTVIKI